MGKNKTIFFFSQLFANLIYQTVSHVFFILALSICFSGCISLGSVEIEIIKPAKIALPNQVNSLLIVNNSLVFPSDTFKNNIQKGLFALDTLTTQLLVSQLNTILNESPRYDTAILIPDIYYRSQSNLLQAISWKDVNNLCVKNNTNALISLEAFGIVDTIIRVSHYDGYAYTTYKGLMLKVNSMWRVYLNDDKQVMERRVRHDTITFFDFDSKKAYFSAITDPKVVEYLAGSIAQQISVKVADRMAPYWQPVERMFYIYENQQMKEAARLAYADKWRDAALIWKTFADHKNKKLAAAACHNMALVCEVEGRLNLAKQWLSQSIERYPTSLSQNYMKQIQQRINESLELDKQFGIEKK